MTTARWIAIVVAVLGIIRIVMLRRRRKKPSAVTPNWVNDKAYERDHGSREDR